MKGVKYRKLDSFISEDVQELRKSDHLNKPIRVNDGVWYFKGFVYYVDKSKYNDSEAILLVLESLDNERKL